MSQGAGYCTQNVALCARACSALAIEAARALRTRAQDAHPSHHKYSHVLELEMVQYKLRT